MLSPQYAEAYYNRGGAYYLRKDYKNAIADYEMALRLDPTNDNARQFLEKAQQQK